MGAWSPVHKFGNIKYYFDGFPTYSQGIPKVCPNYFQSIPNVFLKYSQRFPKVHSKYSQGIPKVFPNYSKSILRVFPMYSVYQYHPKNSQKQQHQKKHTKKTRKNKKNTFIIYEAHQFGFLKVNKSQKHFFLKLHCPKNERNMYLIKFCQLFSFGFWVKEFQEKMLLRMTDP